VALVLSVGRKRFFLKKEAKTFAHWGTRWGACFDLIGRLLWLRGDNFDADGGQITRMT
jgi:hypothetical protein